MVRFEKNSKMPEEQNIPELIQENADVVEAPQPRSSESLPPANPACHASPPALPANLSVAPETIPQNEHLEQTSSNVRASQSPHRNVEMNLPSSSPVPLLLVTPPRQAEIEELSCENPDVQSSFSQAPSPRYSGLNPQNESHDETHSRAHNISSMDDVILDDLSPPNPLPPQNSQEPQLHQSPSEKQYIRRTHVRIETKPRTLWQTFAIYLGCWTIFICGCFFGCIAYCFAREFCFTSNCFIPQPMAAGYYYAELSPPYFIGRQSRCIVGIDVQTRGKSRFVLMFEHAGKSKSVLMFKRAGKSRSVTDVSMFKHVGKPRPISMFGHAGNSRSVLMFEHGEIQIRIDAWTRGKSRSILMFEHGEIQIRNSVLISFLDWYLMTQRLARRAGERKIPGSSPTFNVRTRGEIQIRIDVRTREKSRSVYWCMNTGEIQIRIDAWTRGKSRSVLMFEHGEIQIRNSVLISFLDW